MFQASEAGMSERVALIIGNGNYQTAKKLQNAVHDAEDLETRLKCFGFSTQLLIDATNQRIDRALKSFRQRLKGSEVALVFFAGHGLQIEDQNFLIATDSDLEDDITARHSSLPLNRVIDILERGKATTNIVMLDACRDNPFKASWARSSAKRGLAPVYVPRGTLIAYATSPGQYADDGKGRNGEYTAALLQHIDAIDCSIETMLKRVRNTLNAATGGKQVSWEHTSLAGDFYFNRSVGLKVDHYGISALRDKLFVVTENKESHALIAGLKTLTFGSQNAALEVFEVKKFAKVAKDTLFVVGRNVYQAADGNASAAKTFIRNFPKLAQKLPGDIWRALLDGMLFEVFFNSNGDLRIEFKARYLDNLFSLQEFDDLKQSFEFIANCLRQYPGRFHVIPGTNQEVVLDVVVKRKGDSLVLREIRLGGKNILRFEDEDGEEIAAEELRGRVKQRENFEGELRAALGISKRLLKISYAGVPSLPEEVSVPWGWTIIPARP
jgi:hypothetical protein